MGCRRAFFCAVPIGKAMFCIFRPITGHIFVGCGGVGVILHLSFAKLLDLHLRLILRDVIFVCTSCCAT